MTHNPYILFRQTVAQLRRVAAAPPPPPAPRPQPPAETTAAAIAALDAQFPWLQGAEQRGQPSYRPGPRRAGPTSS